jgi:hypothetical protein
MSDPAAMTCDHCNQPWEVASPGAEEIRDFFLMRAGKPDRRWCLACWKAQHFAQEEAAT